MLKHVFAISLLYIILTNISFAEGPSSKVVYIDATVDEQQLGPLLNKKSKADKFVKGFANRIKDNLVEQGNVAYVAGANGAVSSLEERLSEAQQKKAVVYLAVSTTASRSDCVNILHPKFEKKKYKMTQKPDAAVPQELSNSIANADKESLINESEKIGTLMLHNIRGKVADICCKSGVGNNFLLRISSIPTLIVDFQLSDIDNRSPLSEAETTDRIARAISDAISTYLSTPVRSSIKIE